MESIKGDELTRIKRMHRTSYEQTQETLALLKILALGNRQIEKGEVEPAAAVVRRLRDRGAEHR